MSFMNFKIVNAKNLKMEFKEKLLKLMVYLFTEIIISWHTDIKEALKKNPGQ